MSANDNIEDLLAETPTQTLPDDDRRRISDAIRAADRRSAPRRWWSRAVPAWQAAAACLAIGLITWTVAQRRDEPDNRPTAQPRQSVDQDGQTIDATAFVSIDQPLWGRGHRSVYRSSIANWKPIDTD